MVTISYSLTPEDLNALEEERRGGIPRRALRVTFGILLGSMGLITLWQALLFFPWNRPFANFMIAGMGVVFLWIGLEFPGAGWISRRMFNPYVMSEVQVLEGKLVYSCGGKTKQFRWLPKRGLSESGRFFFLSDFHSEIKLTIPKRALTAEQERCLRELTGESAERAPGPGDEVVCQFFLTQKELDESWAANHRWLGPKYGRVVQRIFCGLLAVVVVWLPRLIGKSWSQEFRTQPGLTACAIGVGLFHLWAATGCLGLKKLSGMDQERRISVSDVEVSVACGAKTKAYKWMRFSSYQETRNLFLLRTQSVEYWTIPKRTLAGNVERLRTLLDRNLPQR
jgi:hypothetical protein